MILDANVMHEGGSTVVSMTRILDRRWISHIPSLGMAMRLAFDLGLHIDMSSHVAEGSISAGAAALRRMVFWGAYTLDQ
jgi:hypothetical protein